MILVYLISLVFIIVSYIILKNLEYSKYDSKLGYYIYQPTEIKAVWIPIAIIILSLPIVNIVTSTALLVCCIVELFDSDCRVKESSWMNKNL